MKKILYKFLPLLLVCGFATTVNASSHREAPLISNDPLADNTDLYVFRSPGRSNLVTIIANFIPFQLPQGGPNYYNFGENIRYEIHIDNNINTPGDDIIYRFTFRRENQDPTTFFNIRLGKENLKTYYTCERSIDGGQSFQVIDAQGQVPPTYIGPRSINSPVGLGATSYDSLITKTIGKAITGERIFCGPADDPFFVDLGGIFDLGNVPGYGAQPRTPYDGLKCKNVSSIALQIDISALQKDHKSVDMASSILDPEYVIGVWASASRQTTRVLNGRGKENYSGDWVQVSRLGMPLTNEAVIPIGYKDLWNSLTPYQDLANLSTFGNYFYNPELALYMDNGQFGTAVPNFRALRIQKNSLGAYGFRNGQDGLYSLKGTSALDNTALAENAFGGLLLPAAGSPRSVDLWPIFHTGVPNLAPYQLLVGKNGNPLAPGKPFINNFLPNGGDMIRLNMAVPVTHRSSPDFSSEGLLAAAVLGLTDPRFNTTTTLQFIPNMDGFPNGRRLEDDVTRIELQAVSGVVLAAIGLPYDDYANDGNYLTPGLLNVLGYATGIQANDTTFKDKFPYVQTPWMGTDACCGLGVSQEAGKQQIVISPAQEISNLGISAPVAAASASPNPFTSSLVVRYHLEVASNAMIAVYDANGRMIKTLVNQKQNAGTYSITWNSSSQTHGVYFISTIINGKPTQTLRVVKQ